MRVEPVSVPSKASAPSTCSKHCLEHRPSIDHEQCSYAMHGRTDGLTKNYSPWESRLTLSIARRGVERFTCNPVEFRRRCATAPHAELVVAVEIPRDLAHCQRQCLDCERQSSDLVLTAGNPGLLGVRGGFVRVFLACVVTHGLNPSQRNWSSTVRPKGVLQGRITAPSTANRGRAVG